MFDELLRLAVRGIDAQHRFVGFLGFGIPLLPRALTPELQIDPRGLILHVFLHAEFGNALLRVEIGRILADDLLVDIEGFFGFAFLQVVFPEGQSNPGLRCSAALAQRSNRRETGTYRTGTDRVSGLS